VATLCIVGFWNFFWYNFDFILEECSRPVVIDGSPLVYFEFVLFAFSKASLYITKKLLSALFGQFVCQIWVTFISSRYILNNLTLLSKNNLFFIVEFAE